MMNCQETIQRIGAYLDDELSQEEVVALRSHMEGCPACRGRLQAERDLVASLALADPASDAVAPPDLWEAVEAKLTPRTVRAESGRGRVFRFFRKPLTIAASIVLFFGVATTTVLVFTQSADVAVAAHVDYSVLLDGLSEQVDASIDRFLGYYDAQPIPASAAHGVAPSLSFGVPPELPGGFILQQAYRLKFGDAPGVAAIYHRGDEPLLVFFHPMLDDGDSGEYQETPCVVGERHGHQVEVGEWRLMHLMDRTTCHCVLTKLDSGSPVLSEIVRIVAPDYAPHAGHDH